MKYKLSELIDIPRLQASLDLYYEIHGIPAAIIDSESAVLAATAWQNICARFHHLNPEVNKPKNGGWLCFSRLPVVIWV